MKFLEKLALVLFSLIILVISVVSCLVVFNVLELSEITNFISENLQNEIVSRTVIGVSAVCILLAIKSLFFPTRRKKKEEMKSGVLLENQDGRLLISKDTIENLVNSVVHSFPDAIDGQTKIFLDVDNNITVYVSILVKEEAIIKQLSAGIQNKIKETIKRNTDLDVKQVNINVKNIESEKNKKDNNVKMNMQNVQFKDYKKQEEIDKTRKKELTEKKQKQESEEKSKKTDELKQKEQKNNEENESSKQIEDNEPKSATEQTADSSNE